MNVSEARLAANRLNALKSSGPRTEEGKARSRTNATKHGMAGESARVEAVSPEFAERRAKWAAVFDPADDPGEWALDQAVASSLRIDRCGRTLEALVKLERERATLAWDQDRAVEAATILARLARDPVLASRQLETTRAGVMLLIDAWIALALALEGGKDWSEDEASKALDLLGVAPDGRSRRRPIDPSDGSDPLAFRMGLALGELDRLEKLCDEVMTPLDDQNREVAMEGDVALLSKSAKLVLRYEREAWRRYRESIRQLRDEQAVPAPVVGRGEAVERNEPIPPPPSFVGERRPSLDQAAKNLPNGRDLPIPVALHDSSRPDGPMTERTHSRPEAVDRPESA